MYLWHVVAYTGAVSLFHDFQSKIDHNAPYDKIAKSNILPLILIYIIGLLITMLISSVSYIFVEKAALDARKVFKRTSNI
jgi:peptidoglycan/LPS O-acetylase OafA/YrhL